MSGFLTPARRAIIRELYGARAGAVEALLAGFKMPVGQSDPVLADFYSNVESLRQASIDFLLKRHQVPPLALTRDSDGAGVAFGEAMVEIGDRSRFEFSDPPHSDEAVRALIIVARAEGGEPLDLVAWAPRSDRLATYHGRAAILGAQQLDEPHFDEPLPVHRGMIPWLQDNRRGIVILDPSRAWRLLDGEALAAVDVAHGIELRHALQPPAPQIVVRQLTEAV